jgi:hypothetical protein
MPDPSPDAGTASPAQQDTAATEPERAQPVPEPMPQPEPYHPEPAMIDIHPPHHGVMTRREVLTHLAIVVAGILIAIGLEQAVEFFHHRHQVAETMGALKEERQQNIKRFARSTAAFHAQTVRYQTNLAVLLYIKAHPAASPESWPGEVNWHTLEFSFSDSAWVTAQQDNVTALMPQKEVREQQGLYHGLGIVEAASDDRNRAVTDVRRFMVQDSNPAHLSPAQLDNEILLAQSVLILHYRLGADMRNLNQGFPDFKPSPTPLEVIDIVHEPHTPDYLQPGAALSRQPTDSMPR